MSQMEKPGEKLEGQSMIQGVEVVPLRKILDERGIVMHMLRNDSKLFTKFGEIYFSVIFPGAIKAWHLHKEMTLHYAVVEGNIKLVLYDDRPSSPTYRQLQELFIGQDNYCLVRVPPGVINGFTALGKQKAIVANCADIPHRPDEIIRIGPFDTRIGYNWALKHG